MSDLAHLEPTEAVNPITGALIRLDSPTECALAIDELRGLEDRIKEVKRVLSARLAEEGKRQGTKILHLPGVQVTLTSRREIQWDLEKLRELKDLGLPAERWNALVRTTFEEKVSASEAKRIAGANEDYERVISAARTDFEGDLYVSKIDVQS